MEKTFIKVRSAKDIIVFSFLIILGCVLILLPTDAAVNIIGFILIMTGLILAFVLKSGYQEEHTRERFLKKERYFQQTMNAEISSAIASRPESIDLSEEDKGSTVRLDVYFSRTSGKAYIQLFEYIPYKYEPCSCMYEYEISRVVNLIK